MRNAAKFEGTIGKNGHGRRRGRSHRLVAVLVASGAVAISVAASAPAFAQPTPIGVNLTTDTMNYSIETRSFGASDGDVLDGCIAAGGPYKLLRFDFKSRNKGNADAFLGAPPPAGQSNDIYVWSPAHGHHHIREFNVYDLLDPITAVNKAPGLKQAFCLMDLEKHDPNAGPGKYNCGNQGLTPGWSDVYSSGLPCQFVNITGVADGTYVLVSRTNQAKLIDESHAYDNGRAVRLTISGTTVTPQAPTYQSSVQVVPPNASGTPLGAAVTWGSNRYDLFYRNATDGRLYRKSQDPSTGVWSPSGAGTLMASPAIVGAPSATAKDKNKIDVFARTTSNTVGHWWTTNGSTWSSETWNVTITGSPVTVASNKNQVMVVFPRPSGNLQARYWNGTAWTTYDIGNGLGAAEQPTLVATNWNEWHVFQRDTSGATRHRAFQPAAGWYAWENLGGIVTAPVSAASWNLGRIDVVGRGTDGGLYRNVNIDNSWWTGWFYDGVSNLAAGPVIVASGPDRLDVLYYENSGGTIFYRHRHWDGAQWTDFQPSAFSGITTSANLFLATFGDPQLGIFHTINDGSIRMRPWW